MITVITAWYNEEFLASIFLRHYLFADEIIILLDESNSDDTVRLLNGYKKRFDVPVLTIKILDMPNGMDDRLKQKQINDEYKSIDNGWVIIADADEFIFIPYGGIHLFLGKVAADVVKVDYFQMYAHESESPLNKDQSVFEQRKYGKRNGFERWKKPAVVRAGKNFKWAVGHHEISAARYQFHNEMLLGAHWYMADTDLAIKRRILGRKNRMSRKNHEAQLSAHNFNITEDDIINECRENINCPLVFQL